LNRVLFTIQIIGQLAWGVVCFLYSPNNLLLFGLNLALAGVTISSNITADKEEVLFFTVYIAFWVIPAFLMIFSSVAGIFETLSLVFQKVGGDSENPRFDNLITMDVLVLKNYLISMLIAPAFRLINWILGL